MQAHSRSPIFLVGLPRSGTTLLNRILDAHPKIQVLEELEALRLTETEINNGMPVAQAQKHYWDIVTQHVQLEENSVVIDKSPYHGMSLDIIPGLFPQSRVIMILRHPYDSALSCFMQDFNPGPVNAQFLNLESCATTCAQFLSLMQLYERAYPDNVTRVHYEDIVGNLNDEVNHILQALGLEWDDAINDFAEQAAKAGPIMTASYQQVTRGIYSSAVNRWKNYQPWLKPFDQEIGPLLSYFGYEP